MATPQLRAALGHIQTVIGLQKGNEETDGALLRAFLSDNDQSAFEALLRRYGPMVLRVCQRTLGHVHDAEDAFQASFLVLARQAASIRKKESLASWLHGVAYRMATHAKRAAARRHKHESRAKPTQRSDPALRAAWQEIQGFLDEEIQRLPETLRGTFVLCCLENRSCTEAAQRLGLEEGTVWKRLSRARKLLQERLTRRGVSLTAVLAAVAVGAKDSSAGVSRSLAAPTVKAAAQLVAGQALVYGLVSAKVINLVEGVNRAMFLGKCKMAILLLSCAAFLGAGLGRTSLRHVGAEPPKGPPSPVEKTRTRASATPEDGIRVRGRVLGPDGKPLAGARLYLSASSPKARTNPVRATSGDDGRFQFTLSRSELAKTSSGAPPPQVMAVAKGHGCDWAVLAADGKTAELTLRLVKDVPIRGRVLDPDGKPVARARIVVRGVSAPKGDDLGGFFKAVKGLVDQAIEARGFLEVVRMTAPYTLAKEWPGPLPGQLAVLTTGADGRFRLAGAGRERIVRLHVEGPAIATADLVVMTRASAKVGHVHGASFDFVAVASRPIRGVVRDKDTRKPLAGVAVGITNWLRESYGAGPRWMTVTDKDGRYELLGLAKAASYELVVRPPEGQLYFHREAQIRDTRGLTPLTADIDMVRGLTVRGKVTDKEGKPIARVRLEYLPVYPNLHVNTKVSGRWRPRSEATTGADGSYVLTVLPGPGAIAVTGPNLGAYMPAFVTPAEMKDKGFLRGLGRAIGDNTAEGGIRLSAHNAVVLLNPGAKDTALVKDVALERPQERKGRVVGPDGKPLTGVTVDGPGCVVKGADFIVRGLNPRGGRALIFYHKGKNLGFFLKEVAAEKDDPFTVKLQPCGSVSGRLVDPDGEPVAGARSLGGLRNRTSLGLKYTTDKQGRFRVEGLVPGLTYWILGPNGSARILKQVVVEPGKHKDVGDLKVPAKE